MSTELQKTEQPCTIHSVVRCYLFSFIYWEYSPAQYILVYAENEQKAREIGVKQLKYMCGDKLHPNQLNLCTFGL